VPRVPAARIYRRPARHHGAAHGAQLAQDLSPFIRWCESRKLIASDPTWSLRLKTPKSDGHHTWTEDEIAAFEAHHPIGSKARLALALGLYTAQRRGDVVRMGRQHIRDGELAVRQGKTNAALLIPVLPELQAIIDATPTGHLTLLVTKTGKSYGANDFSEQFRKWCDDAGLPPSVHSTVYVRRR